MNILLIDNRDSFTFNLAEACHRLGRQVDVVRNDVDASDALDWAISRGCTILISPGPGHPNDAGSTLELIARARGRVPVLGVCLGHQAVVLEAGGEVAEAETIVHGKSSAITHDGAGPFAGLPNPLQVGRYHSLCTFHPPQRFTVHARIGGMAMAISDASARQVGLQFHPESILTPLGDQLLEGCLGWLGADHA